MPELGILVMKRLADDRADRKIELPVAAVIRTRRRRHPDGTELLGVVGKEWRVELVRYYAIVQMQSLAVDDQKAPVTQPIWNFIGTENYYLP